MQNNQKMKIVFWDRGPFEKHKKTVIGTIIKVFDQDFVFDVGTNALIIPHRDVLHIQEVASEK